MNFEFRTGLQGVYGSVLDYLGFKDIHQLRLINKNTYTCEYTKQMVTHALTEMAREDHCMFLLESKSSNAHLYKAIMCFLVCTTPSGTLQPASFRVMWRNRRL